MTREEIVRQIEERKLIAVVRVDDPDDLPKVGEALLAGGVSVVELTMTIPNVLPRIRQVREQLGEEVIVGIGSILNGEMAQEAIDAGAQFVVSPIMRADIIKVSNEAGVPVMVGAYTPTEIQEAYALGSDVVKVFPADQLGPSYFKAVRAPMPHLKLMPTGGVSSDNVHEWLDVGTFALGVGSALVDKKAIKEKRFEVLTEKAKLFSDQIRSYKG